MKNRVCCVEVEMFLQYIHGLITIPQKEKKTG